MGLFDSLYFRTKHYVKQRERRAVLERNQLLESAVAGVPVSMIEGLETVRNYIGTANVLLDIGAHHGKFSKAANAMFDLRETVFFEPNAQQNDAIKANAAGFKYRIENVALADKPGEVTFYLHEDDTMNSIVEADQQVLSAEFPYDDPEKMRQTTVPTDTLDDAVSKLALENPTFFMKIDTQGNELNVLHHGTEVLGRTALCFIEYMFLSPYKNNFSFHDLVGFMDAQGFDCKGALSIQKRPSKKVSAVDFLFVRRSD